MYAKASPSLMAAVIVASAGHFCTTQRADEIEAFFTAHPLPSCDRRISQALENMRANAAMLAQIAQSNLAKVEFWN